MAGVVLGLLMELIGPVDRISGLTRNNVSW